MISGILFFPLWLAAAETDLARQLYEEGNWTACEQECRRVLHCSPADETALLMQASASLRLAGTDIESTLTLLLNLARQGQSPELRARAATDAARILYSRNKIAEAWELAQQAFLTTTDTPTFLAAGSLLLRIRDAHSAQITPDRATLLQLESCRPILASTTSSMAILNTPRKSSSILSKPGQWIVAFYRWAIRPAIGTRCSLNPHCSEYFLQASLKHKLLAIPMIADRLVREPGVVSSRKNAIYEKGQLKVPDPLRDHDFWMTSKP